MRRIALTTAAFILAVAGTSFAQGFIQVQQPGGFLRGQFPW